MAHRTRRRLVRALARLPRCKYCGARIAQEGQRCPARVTRYCHPGSNIVALSLAMVLGALLVLPACGVALEEGLATPPDEWCVEGITCGGEQMCVRVLWALRCSAYPGPRSAS